MVQDFLIAVMLSIGAFVFADGTQRFPIRQYQLVSLLQKLQVLKIVPWDMLLLLVEGDPILRALLF